MLMIDVDAGVVVERLLLEGGHLPKAIEVVGHGDGPQVRSAGFRIGVADNGNPVGLGHRQRVQQDVAHNRKRAPRSRRCTTPA